MKPEICLLIGLAVVIAGCFAFGAWCQRRHYKAYAAMTPQQRAEFDAEMLEHNNLW